MPTIEAVALVTNQGKARIGEMLASGKSFVVDSFVIGANGHDPVDPTLALSPDPGRTGCYCGPEGSPIESITTTGGCSLVDAVDTVGFASFSCPVYTCAVEAGEATGAVSSLCLLGTVVYSPVAGDPEIGTQFLFAIANFPLKYKAAGDRFVYEVFVQL
tara:strand:+ start:174720 stop:175196 length:477 start_codon:yes stop_codon:yes gene_type:complete